MPTPRFLVPDLPGTADPPGGRLVLPPGESHHARRVLRLADGTPVELLDGAGHSATGILREGTAVDLETVVCHPQLPTNLSIAAALPKGPRADQMIDQLTQLGVSRFIPLITRHSQPEPKPSRLEKLRRVVDAALKQSGNPWAMTIEPAIPFTESLDQPGSRWLADTVSGPAENASPETEARHTVWVGPEGGWSAEEREAAVHAGLRCTSLGRHTLRVETAAVVAAAAWLTPHHPTGG
ncbi:MAG: RsmE family RNA methyltransferase [Planctomycetota bacterium]